MRAPNQRPRRKVLDVACTSARLNSTAEAVVYEGSAEHKMAYTWLGPKKLRSDATPCPRDMTDPDVITGWLRQAIRAGQVAECWEDDFPKYVWGIRDGQAFEARLINRGQGNYKGYPISQDELPRGMQ